MKNILFSCVLATLALNFAAAPALGAKIKLKDEQQLRDLHALYWEGWNRHEAKIAGSVFAEDATMKDLSGKWVAGRVAIEKAFVDEHAGAGKESSARGDKVSIEFVARNVAVVDQEVELSGFKQASGKPHDPFALHVVTVSTKKAGKWWFQALRAYVPLPTSLQSSKK